MRGSAFIDSQKQRIFNGMKESGKSPIEVIVDLKWEVEQLKKKVANVDSRDVEALTKRQHDMGTRIADILTRLETLEYE